MSEQCCNSLRCDPGDLNQAMSIHTRKITDSCRDKDCIEDLRVYLTTGSQTVLDGCSSVKVRSAELLYTAIDVERVAFDTHHYCIDITFYYKILADTVTATGRPACLYGLATFSKRAVLCGESSRAHIFRSDTVLGGPDGLTRLQANLPTAVVEVLDPMVLSSKVKDPCGSTDTDAVTVQIPESIRAMFDEELMMPGDHRRLYVTLGQFSIVRLERDAQLVIPVLDYSVPTKECCDSVGCCDQDPCEMFSRIPFPSQQFTPTGCDTKKDDQCQTC